MPFIGTTPTQGFVSAVNKQSFTPNGSTTAFTLSHSVSNANDLEVFVGNVRQEPTAAYSASGTTLTMTEAPATGLNFYVIFKNKAQVTTTPPDNSVGTAKIVNDAVSSAKIATNAVGIDALDLTANYTFTGTVAGISGAGPSFRAYKTSNQTSVTANSNAKITFDAELWDTHNCFDLSNDRFTPNRAGYYLINGHCTIPHAATTARVAVFCFMNGTFSGTGIGGGEGGGSQGDGSFYPTSRATWLIPMNGSSDYIELYAYGTNNGSAYTIQGSTTATYRTVFEGTFVRDL